jgi:hypothetical protein
MQGRKENSTPSIFFVHIERAKHSSPNDNKKSPEIILDMSRTSEVFASGKKCFTGNQAINVNQLQVQQKLRHQAQDETELTFLSHTVINLRHRCTNSMKCML